MQNKTVYNIFKKIALFTAIFIAGSMSFASTPVSASTTTTGGASCPFTASTNTYVVNFGNKTLFSNQGASNAYLDIATNIPAGTYDITLYGYDDHAAHGGQGQTMEKYFLILSGSGTEVARTNSLDDIPENANSMTTLVNSNLTLSKAITSIRAQHTGYPSAKNYQSIIPICAQFKNKSVPVEPVDPLAITCTVSKTTVSKGESLTYSATVSGGKGPFTYTWSGARSGNTSSITTSFSNPGTYSESIQVKDSLNKTATAQCTNVVVEEPTTPTPNLSGSCYANPSNGYVGQNTVWYADASGGNGSYTYSWSGTENLSGSGSSVNKVYGYSGNKSAQVVITSGSQSITRTCSTYISSTYTPNPPTYYPPYIPPYNPPYYPTPTYNPVSVTCSANPSQATTQQNVIWNAYASGGNGSFTYSWTGTDGLSYGNASAIQKVYTTSGVKMASVTVYSNGQSNTANCSVTVIDSVTSGPVVIREPNLGTPVSGVYLSQIPATGIDLNLKVALFVLGLLMWSGFAGYVLIKKHKKLSLRTSTSTHSAMSTASMSDKISAFKVSNMQKKGLIK